MWIWWWVKKVYRKARILLKGSGIPNWRWKNLSIGMSYGLSVWIYHCAHSSYNISISRPCFLSAVGSTKFAIKTICCSQPRKQGFLQFNFWNRYLHSCLILATKSNGEECHPVGYFQRKNQNKWNSWPRGVQDTHQGFIPGNRFGKDFPQTSRGGTDWEWGRCFHHGAVYWEPWGPYKWEP